jgi:hypothetical protein
MIRVLMKEVETIEDENEYIQETLIRLNDYRKKKYDQYIETLQDFQYRAPFKLYTERDLFMNDLIVQVKELYRNQFIEYQERQT